MEPYELYDMFGHPLGMEVLAGRLRSIAQRVEARSAHLTKRVDETRFEGPAARRFRDRMSRGERDARSIAIELGELADSLMRAASRAQADIDAYLRSHSEDP